MTNKLQRPAARLNLEVKSAMSNSHSPRQMAHKISDPSIKVLPMTDQLNCSNFKCANAFGKETRFGYQGSKLGDKKRIVKGRRRTLIVVG